MMDFIEDITIEDVFFILVVWIGVLIILWAFIMVIKKMQDAENKAQPVRKKMAEIVDMQRMQPGEIVFGEIWVMFELEDGSRLRLNAKAQNHLIIGDIGLLTWQGRKILNFERKKT